MKVNNPIIEFYKISLKQSQQHGQTFINGKGPTISLDKQIECIAEFRKKFTELTNQELFKIRGNYCLVVNEQIIYLTGDESK